MRISPVPDFSFNKLWNVTPEFLRELGIKFLLLDLDNTMARYSETEPSPWLLSWVDSMKSKGITLFIVSNNRGSRPGKFAEALDIGFINRARKPSGKNIRKAMERMGALPEETAMIGDQVYTDVMAGNACGTLTIVLRPLSIGNPYLALRYYVEFPFRMLCKERRDK